MAEATLLENISLLYQEWQARKGRNQPTHDVFSMLHAQALILGVGHWSVLDAMRQRAWEWILEDPFVARCPLCSRVMWKFNGQTWNASHVLANANGGSRAKSNLRALCEKCNGAMGSEHMYDYVLRLHPEAISVLALEPPRIHDRDMNLKVNFGS